MKKLLILGSLICLFTFGAVCGFAVAMRVVKNNLNEDYFVRQRIAEESRRLKLTSEQLEKAKSSYEQLKRDLVTVKSDTLQAITMAIIKQSTELATFLDSEQLEEFKKLNDERRARMEKNFKS